MEPDDLHRTQAAEPAAFHNRNSVVFDMCRCPRSDERQLDSAPEGVCWIQNDADSRDGAWRLKDVTKGGDDRLHGRLKFGSRHRGAPCLARGATVGALQVPSFRSSRSPRAATLGVYPTARTPTDAVRDAPRSSRAP